MICIKISLSTVINYTVTYMRATQRRHACAALGEKASDICTDAYTYTCISSIYKRRLLLEDNWIIDPARFPESDVREKTSIGAATEITDILSRSGKTWKEGGTNCRIVGVHFTFFSF